MDIAGAIREAFRATAEIFGYKREKATRENAPDVRQSEIGQEQTNEQSKIECEVAKQNEEAIRRRLAE